MKPPQEQAVAKALSILMGGVSKENDAQFLSTKFSAAFAPLSTLPDNAEALKLAKFHINTKLDTLISCMQHRRNLAASIHKLPTDVLVMVFAAYTKSTSLSNIPSLLDLMTVNNLWHNAIVHSPQLWTVLESDFTPRIARLLLQRSKNLPLSLVWDCTHYKKNEEEDPEEVLELAIQNSSRLKSISMRVPQWSSPSIRRLLESNMPHLEKLEVKTVLEDSRGEELLDEFILSDGSSLRKIALEKMHLASWSSPRLMGLLALDLSDPRCCPSIDELLDILSNSPQLERLCLCNLGYLRSPWKRSPNGLIILSRLKEILLRGLDGLYLSAILTSVYAPSSRNVHIEGRFYNNDSVTALEEVCLPGNSQLLALLGLEDCGSPSLEVPVSVVVDSPVIRIAKVGDAEKREVALYLYAGSSPQVVDLLGRFFLAVSPTPHVDLRIGAAASRLENAVFDLLPWSRSLHTLSVHGPVVCRPVLKQLAERTEDSITGVMTWVCPNLTSIQLCYMHPVAEELELDGLAIEALVRARWLDGSAAGQLSEFTIRCEEERYPSIWSRGDVLKQVMSCISLCKESCTRI